MKWSFEIPIRYIERLKSEVDYLFILPQHLSNKEYYRIVKEWKGEKYLDNGAYELGESIDTDRYIKIMKDIKPDVVIVPDVLFNYEESKKRREEFLSKVKDIKVRKIGVIQGKTFDEYIRSYYELLSNKDIDIIGVSRTRDMMWGNSLVFFQNVAIVKPIHLLGLSNPLELTILYRYGSSKIKIRGAGKGIMDYIESIDTGLPVNFAIVGMEIMKVNMWNEFKRVSGEDIDYEGDIDIGLIKRNIEILKEYVR